MATKKKSKNDEEWARAKSLCRLSVEDITKAKALGMSPKSLIKNIPSKSQQWKAPVKVWIQDLYEEKFGRDQDRTGERRGAAATTSREPLQQASRSSTGDDLPGGTVPKSPSSSTRFAPGDRVRVRAGVRDADFPDLCIEGWTGKVAEVTTVGEDRRPLVTVRWDQRTRDSVSAEYRARCKREGYSFGEMDLYAADLEPDDTPASNEPQKFDADVQDDRLSIEDEPPDVDRESLKVYHQFLGQHLKFPFQVVHTVETGMFTEKRTDLKITGLLALDEVPDLDSDGLFCRCRNPSLFRGSSTIVRLADIEIEDRKDPNLQLVEDYRYWFWNFR